MVSDPCWHHSRASRPHRVRPATLLEATLAAWDATRAGAPGRDRLARSRKSRTTSWVTGRCHLGAVGHRDRRRPHRRQRPARGTAGRNPTGPRPRSLGHERDVATKEAVMAVDVEIDVDLLKNEIKKTYASVSQDPERDFIFPTGRAWAEDLRYPSELASVPDTAVESFAGGRAGARPRLRRRHRLPRRRPDGR